MLLVHIAPDRIYMDFCLEMHVSLTVVLYKILFTITIMLHTYYYNNLYQTIM